MTAAERPPVSEVVVSISFEGQPLSTGPQLLISLGDLVNTFPSIQEQPLYEMPEELPPEDELLKPAVPQFNFSVGMPVDRRYWLTASEPGPYLLQAQPNYFALNWRDQGGKFDYPGFETVKTDFDSHLSTFEQSIVSRGGDPLQIKQVEVTYINLVRPDSTWRDISEFGRVVDLGFAGLPVAEQVSFAYSKLVAGESEPFAGRVHTALQTGYEPDTLDLQPRPLTRADLKPVINISITTRSSALKSNSSDVSRHIDAAHDATISAFHSLMTEAALQRWGLA